MPGPAPMPLERKRMLGNPGKEKLPAKGSLAPVPSASVLSAPPAHLGPTGKKVWRAALALGARWIAQTDERLLGRYCEALDERELLRGMVAERGLTTTGSQGQEVVSPWYKALKDLDRDLTRYEQLLGFTPADRARLGVAEVVEQSRLDAFLGGGEAAG
jgi:P27 family predicted phage terminase small subunit